MIYFFYMVEIKIEKMKKEKLIYNYKYKNFLFSLFPINSNFKTFFLRKFISKLYFDIEKWENKTNETMGLKIIYR